MEKNLKEKIDDFIENREIEDGVKRDDTMKKKVILDEREGLIERVDKIFITKDGKQLLREWY